MAALNVRPVTAELWPALEALFGPSGAYSGCWCMFLRVTARTFEANCAGGGAGNRAALKALVEGGHEPGLLAFRDDVPVGWVAVAPREEYGRILRSPVHGPSDPEPNVFSVSCFFIAREARGEKIATELLLGAVDFARAKGAASLEAYPNDSGPGRRPAAELWRGTVSLFRRAGFREVARRRPGRPIMRLELG